MTLMRFSNRYPTLFDRFFENDLFDWSNRNFSATNTTVPAVNIKEDEEKFEVAIAAPGFDKKDFKLELNNDVLTISSEKEVQNELKNNEQYSKQEFSYQSFSRSFTLPNTVHNEKISAKYDKGILYVRIPKREEAKPKPVKQISIS